MPGAGAQTLELIGAEKTMEFGRAVEGFDYELEPVRSASHPIVTRLTMGVLGSINATRLHLTVESAGTARGNEDTYVMDMPQDGILNLKLGRSRFTATPDAAALIGPLDHVAFHGWHAGSEDLIQFTFSRQALERELSQMLAKDLSGPIRFPHLLDLRRGLGAQWAHMIQPIFHALDDPRSMAWNPLMGARLSSLTLSSLLLVSNHNYREDLENRSRPTTPPVIRRAVAYIEEHAHNPITIPMIAAAVGYSVRTLQRGFDEHLDTTPLAYLKRVRLDRVHHELLVASPESTTVAEVASRWGFDHLGYFAANYRTVYGELPSATLRDR